MAPRLAHLIVFGFGSLRAVAAACSKDGEDCSFTGCCETEDHKCFRKSEGWSACNASCAPNRIWKDGKWQDTDKKTWDCEAILPHMVAKAPECKDPKNGGEDCSESGCCAKKDSICFRKDKYHSSCNATCTPYAMWDKDRWVTTPEPVWDCTVVKPVLATYATEHKCTKPADNGIDCSNGGCCKDEKSTCFRKNKHWSSCNASCQTNMKWVDDKWVAQKEQVWDCAVVYPPAVPKVDCENPVADGANCTESACCKDAGSVCFKKNEHWASCRKRCWTNKVWESSTVLGIGSRVVDVNGQWVEKDHQIWDCGVLKRKPLACTKDGDDCSFTGCCQTQGHKCFRKTEGWSACNASCAPNRIWQNGNWQDTDKKTWDCEAILPHMVAKAPKCKDPKQDGEDCSETGCCARKGSICFRKDKHHSSCNATCTPYAKWDEDKWVTTTDPVWNCTVVKPVVADGSKEHKCTRPADSGLDCSDSGCCKDEKSTCFRKNEHWSSCNASCQTNMKWVDDKWVAQKEQVWDCAVVYPPAVPKVDCENPVADGANCIESGCCIEKGSVCFKKNDHFASCSKRCWTNKVWEGSGTAGKWVEKDHQIWDCGVIQPKPTPNPQRLYEISEAMNVADQEASQPWDGSRPWLAALVLGIVAGGSVAAFRSSGRPQLVQESSDLE